MKAYNTATDTTYDSWEELMKQETHGWTVVVIMSCAQPSGKRATFARVIGIFAAEQKGQAKLMAAQARRRFRKHSQFSDHKTEVITVAVEPIWNELPR